MDTSQILQDLTLLNEQVVQNQPGARQEMIGKVYGLLRSLQPPNEFIADITWTQPALSMCVRVAINLNIFEMLQDAGHAGMSVADIAAKTSANIVLIARIMRHLAALHVVAEIAPSTYASTNLSNHMTKPKYSGGIVVWRSHDLAGKAFNGMPEYFVKTEYCEPMNPFDGPFQYVTDTKGQNFYAWAHTQPMYLENFGHYMSGYRDGNADWFQPNFYPVQERLIDGFDPSNKRPFLVDLGGGRGHDILALHAAYPNIPGTMILQDRPEVIDAAEPAILSGEKTQALAHDFFTPQPEFCHGARCYFMHSIFHNWDDESCVKILESLKPALVPGYSKVLINDLIVPDEKAIWYVTSMDLLMCSLLCVKERTRAQVSALFERVGMVVTNVSIYEQGSEGVIEATLPVS